MYKSKFEPFKKKNQNKKSNTKGMKPPKGRRCYWRQKEGCGVRPVQAGKSCQHHPGDSRRRMCGIRLPANPVWEFRPFPDQSAEQMPSFPALTPWVPAACLVSAGGPPASPQANTSRAPLERQRTKISICLSQMSLGPALCITNIPPAASDTWVQDSSPHTLRIQVMSLDQENN